VNQTDRARQHARELIRIVDAYGYGGAALTTWINEKFGWGYSDIAAIINSPTAMNAIVGSSATIENMVGSPLVWTVMVASPAVMTAMISAPAAWALVADSYTAVRALTDDPTTWATVLASSVLMTGLAGSIEAVRLFVSSTRILNEVCNASAARSAMEGSSVARTAIEKLANTVTLTAAASTTQQYDGPAFLISKRVSATSSVSNVTTFIDGTTNTGNSTGGTTLNRFISKQTVTNNSTSSITQTLVVYKW